VLCREIVPVNADVVEKLTGLMKKYIADGRSTVGAAQKNDAEIAIDGATGAGKKNRRKRQAATESTKEIELALDPQFD
jgi:hypothetical protein